MKIKIKKKDQRYKRLIKIGEIADLPDRVADRIITKGCGEVVDSKLKEHEGYGEPMEGVEAEPGKESILEVKKPKRKRKKKWIG